MKKKIQILLMISILLSGVSWLDCMMTSAARQTATKIRRPITDGISPAAAARLAAVKSQTPLLARTAQTKSDTSTWSGWVQSWFRGSQSTPATSSRVTVARTARSPFAPIQSSAYHTTVPQKSWFDNFKSIFAEKPSSILTMSEIDWLAWGSYDEKEKRPLFNSDDLERAKQKFGTMIEEHPEYKDKIIQKFEYFIRFSHYRNPDFTLLDKVFYHMLLGDELFPSEVNMRLSDRAINQTKLIKYLMDKGARINPQNAEMYKEVYFNYLMPSYKRLYGPNRVSLYGTDYEIEKFKELFKELDPILEEIIPGFKEEVKKAWQERADIEANPDKYKKEMKDERNRSKYIRAKARQLWAQAGAYYQEKYWNEFIDQVRFNEAEYQRFVRDDGDEHYFASRQTGGFGFERNNFNQDMLFQKQEKAIWDLLPGLSAHSSKKDIAQAYRNFMKKNHPDLLQDLPEAKKKKREEKAKLVNAAWDEYNEQLKSQQSAKE